MRAIFFVVFILFSSFFSTAADPSDNDERPGSRTIYVTADENFSLKFMLRKCICEKAISIKERRLCDCFSDLRKSDQPFVQGSCYNIVFSFEEKFNERFPGFNYGEDEATENFFFRVPRPERLLEILQYIKNSKKDYHD